uniref:Uncharacterized protein n=1 Tax=Ciona savignyi TaxID=51511 RepID=H2YJC2_CIOSA
MVFQKTFILTLLLVYIGSSFAIGGLFLSKEQASEYLKREKRANSGFEEFAQGNAEQECIEEICSYEEAREVFEDDAQTAVFWNSLTKKCNTAPCNGDGTASCTNEWNNYTCNCSPGFTGTHCETDIDECQDEEMCVNGTCFNSIGSYNCVCGTGYTGERCDEDINECEGDWELCSNGGTCVNDVGTYHCACPAGWLGSDCSQDVDECALNLCPEGATCEHGVNHYTCYCPEDGCGTTDNVQQSQED